MTIPCQNKATIIAVKGENNSNNFTINLDIQARFIFSIKLSKLFLVDMKLTLFSQLQCSQIDNTDNQ